MATRREYDVDVKKSAWKYYEGQAAEMQARIRAAIRELRENPKHGGTGILESDKTKRKVRVGGLRVIYKIDEENRTMIITKISPRGEAYKR